MIREMTLGQYYKAQSLIHQLDPRVKLAGTLLFVITLFFPKSAGSLLIATVFLAGVVGLSKVPVSLIVRGVRPLFFIICFSAVIHLFQTEGHLLMKMGIFSITREGIWTSFYLVVRLVYLVAGSSVMTFTTTPNQLTDGLEKGFHFLKKVHVPVHEIAMMMSIALRFIPILTEELDKIMKAQMSRGIDFESGGILERGKKLIPLFVPLFIAAIRRASDLALAMDARCYHGGEGKTQLHPLKYQKRDYAAYGILFLYVLLMGIVGFAKVIG